MLLCTIDCFDVVKYRECLGNNSMITYNNTCYNKTRLPKQERDIVNARKSATEEFFVYATVSFDNNSYYP